MRNPGGYATWTGGDEGGGILEKDTFTCCHCNRVKFVEPNCRPADAGGFCMMCMKPTCGGEGCAVCIPFEKKLEAIERNGAARRSLNGILPW